MRLNSVIMFLILLLFGCATRAQVNTLEQLRDKFMRVKGVDVNKLSRDNAEWIPLECIVVDDVEAHRVDENSGVDVYSFRTAKSTPTEMRFRASVCILSNSTQAAYEAFSAAMGHSWFFLVAKTFENHPFERLSDDSFVLLNPAMTILVYKNILISVVSTGDSKKTALAILDAGLKAAEEEMKDQKAEDVKLQEQE